MIRRHILSGSSQEAIYRQYAPQVFTYLLRHLSSQQDAEDLLVEVFLAILEKPPALAMDDRHFAAYVQTIARNKMVDYYRQRGNQQFIPLEEVPETTYEADNVTPEQYMLARERLADLHRTVNSLPEIQQVILRLRFVHGLRHGEIARLLARREGSVRMMLNRALKRLRSLNPIYQER